MPRVRLRTKFLLSLLLIISALTCASLLIVQNSVRIHVRREIFDDLRNSVLTFQNVQRQRELTLTRSAELLANLPLLKSLMTTRHAATIQDASSEVWPLSGSDLFVLADRTGKLVALHAVTRGFTRNEAQEFLRHSIEQDEPGQWWFGGGHAYEVFLQPIYFGSPAENSLLGILAVGYEIDERMAQQVSRVAASQVAFCYGETIVATTLSPAQEAELRRHREKSSPRSDLGPDEIQLGEERFLATSVDLAPGAAPAVRLSVLKSYDQATVFMKQLNQLLLGLGVVAVLGGTLLVFLISHTFTRPLANLVAGVRALEKGDFGYPLQAESGDEVAEVSGAFDRMRTSLRKTQEQLLDSERLAIIGRMAGSISHDLRHPLAAVVANAEFLCESNLKTHQREDLYQEIRVAVNQMTGLIDSLLEFSRTRESLRPVYGGVVETIERALQAIRAHPEFGRITITVSREGRGEGWFDPKKLERVFYNLLMNACQAVKPDSGQIELSFRDTQEGLEIRIVDNGPGIAEAIRDKLFQPFVSYGKENGTGLGLTIVQKIVQDHGGEVKLASTAPGRTVFELLFPHSFSSSSSAAIRTPAGSVPPLARVEPPK